MILLLIEYLEHHMIHVPAAFSYCSTRMVLAALTTLLITIFCGPFVIETLFRLKTGRSIRVGDCPKLAKLHQKKKQTPTMGGILILFSMVIALFIWMDLRSSFTLILLLTTLWLGTIGVIDDYLKLKHKNAKGLQAKKKLFFQLFFAALLGIYLVYPHFTRSIQEGEWFKPPSAKMQTYEKIEGNRELIEEQFTTDEYATKYFIPFMKKPFFSLNHGFVVFGVFITLFVITGSSNAVNLTDGLDGLASGCILLVSLVLAIVAFLSNHSEISRYLNILYIEKSSEIAVYLSATFGACLGFLWYNGYPAEVFMGDTGSLALGGVLGVAAVLLRREGLLALIGGIFVIEALSVILQVMSYKMRRKKRIFLCAPLHHHFEYKGWPETKVVLRFWLVGLILAMIGLASLKFQ